MKEPHGQGPLTSSPHQDFNTETTSSFSITSVEDTMTLIEEERVLIQAVVGALTPAFTMPQRGLMKQVCATYVTRM